MSGSIVQFYREGDPSRLQTATMRHVPLVGDRVVLVPGTFVVTDREVFLGQGGERSYWTLTVRDV